MLHTVVCTVAGNAECSGTALGPVHPYISIFDQFYLKTDLFISAIFKKGRSFSPHICLVNQPTTQCYEIDYMYTMEILGKISESPAGIEPTTFQLQVY